TLGVLVGELAALRDQHLAADVVLGGDQLDVIFLALVFEANGIPELRIGLGKKVRRKHFSERAGRSRRFYGNFRDMRRALFAFLLIANVAHAYPNKPVRVIVAFTPGGVTDIVARTLMPKLGELWGQPVLVENRPGAGGTVAAVAVARATPDGSTLLVHSAGYAINAALSQTLPYDPQRDFVHVAPLASQAMLLVVSPASSVRSVAELIAAAKARPGELAYGSAGIGSGGHFSAEKFRIAA